MLDPETLIQCVKDGQVPALQLVPAPPAAKVFSKIGGYPHIPMEIAWPNWKGRPLAFLAQIAFTEIPESLRPATYPATGCLFFFYDQEQSTWGFDPADRGSWQVIYVDPCPEATPAVTLPGLAKHAVYEEKRVQFRAIPTFPSLERMEIEEHQYVDIPDSVINELGELDETTYQCDPAHQMSGFPGAVQSDSMELECQLVTNGLYCGNASGYEDPRRAELAPGARDWKLLLQLDTDDDLNMMWGDCGRLYFWIREDDLIARNFSNVWMILQCS